MAEYANPYAAWSHQRFLDAFNLQHGRTHTIRLEAYQVLEQLHIASSIQFTPGGPLHLGGHTVYCEPDPASKA